MRFFKFHCYLTPILEITGFTITEQDNSRNAMAEIDWKSRDG